MPLNRLFPYLTIFLLFLLYYCFDTNNAGIDSWYYAACVKHKHELINSHHLLYNVFGRASYLLLGEIRPNIEAIEVLNFINSIAAAITLFFLHKTLRNLNQEANTAMTFTLLCGVSYGFMRYATDAETYIMPVCLSVLSIYFLSLKEKKYFLSGLLISGSVLFHQLHIWLCLSIFIAMVSERQISKKNKMLFILPLFLIPLFYFIAWYFSSKASLFNFIIGEYAKGNAGLDFSIQSILLTLINVVRTFIQVHGQIIFLFYSYTKTALISILIIVAAVFWWLKNLNRNIKIGKNTSEAFLRKSISLALFLQLIFACLSSGNAEFMVLLPFLMVILICLNYKIKMQSVQTVPILALLVWNLLSGILPNHFLDINQENKQISTTLKNKNAIFLWENKVLIDNKLCYLLNFNHRIKLLKLDSAIQVEQLIHDGHTIYTDFGSTVTKYSRQGLLEKSKFTIDPKQFKFEKADSFTNIYGKNYIYQIKAIK